MVGESDDSTAAEAIATHIFEDDQVTITKVEHWAVDESVVVVSLTVTNNTVNEISNLRLLYAVDSDQDSSRYSDYTTKNNVQNLDGAGASDYVESVGPTSGNAISFGACDPDNSELGHYTGWANSDTDADTAITDEAAATSDDAMVLRWTSPDSVGPGESLSTSFLILVSDTEAGAEDLYLASTDRCGSCDADEDGYESLDCGGDDCDDIDGSVNPGATETWYDGLDQDCHGDDDYDQDKDGHIAQDYGGTDCLDTDATAYPGATDEWYDGIDSDCSGNNDDDQDGDGDPSADVGGGDCDDLDPAISSDTEEVWYDGVDQDCDGNDDDQDADGSPVEDDCDDTDPDVAEDCSGGDGGGGDGGDGADGTDTGASAADEEEVPFKPCSCSSSPQPGAALPAAALVGILVLRRRRRS